MKKEKKIGYSVYVHKCPNGMVYAGCTSLVPYKRWKGGNGYTQNKEFAPLIMEYGWSNIEHKVIATGLDKEFAEYLEAVMIQLVKPEYSLNTYKATQFQDLTKIKYAQYFIYKSDIATFYGDSLDSRAYTLHTTDYTQSSTEPEPSKSIVTEVTVTKPLNNNAKMKQKQTKKIQPMAVRTAAGVRLEMTLDTRYLRQDGQYPVTIRMYQNRKYKYIQTGYSSTPWNFPSFTSSEEDVLMKKFDSVCSELTHQMSMNGYTDILSVDTKAKQASTLEEVMMAKRDLMETPATRNNYTSTLRILEKIYPNGLPVERIGSATIGRVLDWLNTNGYSPASSNIYLSAIKASINYGIYKGWVKQEQYPFQRNPYEVDKVVMPQSGKRDDHYLTMDEMHKLWNYFKETKNVYAGLFLFSYLIGGANLADVLELRFDDFYFKEHGFRFQRIKTQHKNHFKTAVPATEWTDEIISTLGITPQKGELVFKMFAKRDWDAQKKKANVSACANKSLERIGKLLYFERKLSMTYARHTFATVANKTGMPFNVIEASMGHSNRGVSSHYIGIWNVDELRPFFQKLL